MKGIHPFGYNYYCEAPIQFTITDFAGRLIRDNTLANETVTGKQTFTIPLDEMQLAPGIYIVRVKTGTTEFQRKLIVQ